jgi:gentisate 1,2-dioxygenase
LFLFVASDEPTLKKLALYKKWGKSASGEISQIVD